MLVSCAYPDYAMLLCLLLLLAKNPPPMRTWPDGYDRLLTVVYLAVILGLPLLGYVFMVLDFRRYLRSLRRAMVRVASAVPVTPYWALRQRPTCLKVLGLELPCTEADVLTAYRKLAKTQHPDAGGDLNQFLRLQRYFEEASELVRKEAEQTISLRS